MRKFIILSLTFSLTLLIIFIVVLQTVGFETEKFNNIISKKVYQNNKNINIKLSTVKFKLDIKEISLYLETENPSIDYQNIVIPVKNIKLYIDFLSLIKSEAQIKKINLVFKEFEIHELKKISKIFKPSNFKSFLRDKVQNGKINAEIEIYLNDKNLLDNFIARGSVTHFSVKIYKNIVLEKTSFTFTADKTDVLIKKIFSESDQFKIKQGDLKVKLSPEINLTSNFRSSLKYNGQSKDLKRLFSNFRNIENFSLLDLELTNYFSVNFDKTYKVKNFNYKNNGEIIKAKFYLNDPIDNSFLKKKINLVSLINTQIKSEINLDKSIYILSGKYLLKNENPLKFKLESIARNDNSKINFEAEFNRELDLKYINYRKTKGTIANIKVNLDKQKENYIINEFKYNQNNNVIVLKGLKLVKKKFLSLKNVSIKTFNKNQKNNDFTINYGDKISIKGSAFDATNFPKLLNNETKKNDFFSVTKNIEVDLESIIAPLSEQLKNFKLIGEIKNGKFTKISSKGDFGENNFLDINLKNDEKNKNKKLEIYSDLTEPFLTEYKFFKGLSGGKLLYSSLIGEKSSSSKLKIENFKVQNAPGLVKLLSLADLGGLADLAEGDGISFDILEINMKKTGELLRLNEILAVGPSISVLMEGYQDKEITSLRGTLVPAKTLNKMISKIPVIGEIVIPKEVGEGLFGISFKIKGPPGKIKTTINPIRTITPRFIQKIIDKNKKSK